MFQISLWISACSGELSFPQTLWRVPWTPCRDRVEGAWLPNQIILVCWFQVQRSQQRSASAFIFSLKICCDIQHSYKSQMWINIDQEITSLKFEEIFRDKNADARVVKSQSHFQEQNHIWLAGLKFSTNYSLILSYTF